MTVGYVSATACIEGEGNLRGCCMFMGSDISYKTRLLPIVTGRWPMTELPIVDDVVFHHLFSVLP